MSSLAKPRELRVDLPLEAIAGLCRIWHILRLEVFGSALREDFGSKSDIDLLYTFAADARIGWDIVSVAEDFERLLGRPVDLISRQAVERSSNWIRRREILNSAKTIYAE
jgi:predicted nucleotidyltransferase